MSRPETTDHEHDERIDQAADWLCRNFRSAPRPLLPHMRMTFGISSAEAVAAIRAANDRRRDHGGF
jgi:hypothetical protein